MGEMGFDWGSLAEQFGLLEYGVESLGERVEALRELPEVAGSQQLQDVLGANGMSGHLEWTGRVLARVDSKLKEAFELLGASSLNWEDFKAIAGGWVPPRPPTFEGDDDG
ncbi:hypothetical protein [Mycobacterium sp. HNNTM2301]|uniref:hypothetical protein n=1 Tax=Mycobacterium hainanense TaxID=3289775 RepID=UPI0035A72D6F